MPPEAGTTKGVVEIIMIVHPATGWDDVKKMMTTDSNRGAKPVSGLGEDAFDGRFLGYNVRKGNRYVQVFGDMRNDNAANDKATRYLAERQSRECKLPSLKQNPKKTNGCGFGCLRSRLTFPFFPKFEED